MYVWRKWEYPFDGTDCEQQQLVRVGGLNFCENDCVLLINTSDGAGNESIQM